MSKGIKVNEKESSKTRLKEIPAAPVLPSMVDAYASWKNTTPADLGTKTGARPSQKARMSGNRQRPTQTDNRSVLTRMAKVHQEYMHQIHFAHQQFLQGPWATFIPSNQPADTTADNTLGKTSAQMTGRNPSIHRFGPLSLPFTEADIVDGHLYFPALMRRVTELFLSYLNTSMSAAGSEQWEIGSLAYQVFERMPVSKPSIPALIVSGRIRLLLNGSGEQSTNGIDARSLSAFAEFELDVTDGKRTLIHITKGAAKQTHRPADVKNRTSVSGHQSMFEAAAVRMTSGQLQELASGRLDLCFGAEYAEAATHVRPPVVSMQSLRFEQAEIYKQGDGLADTVVARSVALQEESAGIADCIEASFQLSAMALSYAGFTLNKDGYRFEPVLNQTVTVNCSFPQELHETGEILWNFTDLRYEDSEEPSVSGRLRAATANRQIGEVSVGGAVLRLDYPISSYLSSPGAAVSEGAAEFNDAVESEDGAAIFELNGFRYDKASLLHGAWGKPSNALGPLFRRFDKGTQMPRLPGPPFQFISRIVHVDGPIAEPRIGTVLTCEYDIPKQSWYFQNNGGVMPFSVLMEAALQPCGWLSGYMGIPLQSDEPLYFRNLDGTGTQHRDIQAGEGVLRTVVTVKGISRVHSTFLQTYAVECSIGNKLVFQVETVFGHFPEAGLARQVGLPGIEQAERNPLELKGTVAELTDAEPGLQQLLPWVGTRLQMADRIVRVDLKSNDSRARIIAEKTITPGEWFFKAHFLHDPVQPGSLGIESILQVLQWYMVDRGMVQAFTNPSFEAVRTGVPVAWKYRGQVLPKNKSVRVVVDVLEEEQQASTAYVSARAVLWVDGHAIYEVNPIAVAVRDSSQDVVSGTTSEQVHQWSINPDEIWLKHHRPTYTLPVMPFMFLMDDMMKSVEKSNPDMKVIEVANVKIHGWFVCDRPRHVRTTVTPVADNPALFNVVVSVWRDPGGELSAKIEQKMTALVRTAKSYPDSPQSDLAQLEDKDLLTENPYESGRLFHGKSFQILRELAYGSNGSSALLDLAATEMPQERWRSLILDSITHAIPHDQLERWHTAISKGQVAYPYRVTRAQFFSDPDFAGGIQCEVRFAGFFQENKRFPTFTARVQTGECLWLELELVEILFPTSSFVTADGRDRRRFLQDKQFVPGLSLARLNDDSARLSAAEVRNANWLSGTLESVYDIRGKDSELAKKIAEKELVASVLQVHPAHITVENTDASGVAASCPSQPFVRAEMESTETAGEWHTSLKTASTMNIDRVHSFWQEKAGVAKWIIWDIYRALVKRFVGRFHIMDPASFYGDNGGSNRPVLFLANHQTGVESLLFSYLVGGLRQMPVVGLAKKEHRQSWIGRLLEMTHTYPPANLYRTMILFDRSDQKSMLQILRDMADVLNNERLSALIHVEGTRSTSTRKPPVQTMSSTLIDLAVSAKVPIIPVRFARGLPTEDTGTRYEFPAGWGKQDYWIGRPIQPAELEAMEYAERKKTVIEAVNALGPAVQDENPYPGDEAWEQNLRVWRQQFGVAEPWAVILQCLEEFPEKTEQTASFLESVKGNKSFSSDFYEDWLAQLFRHMTEV